MYNRDSEWGTYDNRWVKVRDMEDTHLANLIKHLQTYTYNRAFLLVLLEEVKIRGLKWEFIERAHIPFKDKDGNWMLWSNEKREPVKVG